MDNDGALISIENVTKVYRMGAVIALVAAVEGAQPQVLSQFESLGSNLLTVSAWTNFGFSSSGLQEATPSCSVASAG
jgi:ABC-type antimicrobial peptide transport system permease subunit